METQEAHQKLLWRIGFIVFSAGVVHFFCGVTYQLHHLDWIKVSLARILWFTYAIYALALGGGCWLLTTAYREGAFHRGSFNLKSMLPHLGVPFVATALYPYTGVVPTMGLQIAVLGLVLIASGVWTMRSKLDPPGVEPKPWL